MRYREEMYIQTLFWWYYFTFTPKENFSWYFFYSWFEYHLEWYIKISEHTLHADMLLQNWTVRLMWHNTTWQKTAWSTLTFFLITVKHIAIEKTIKHSKMKTTESENTDAVPAITLTLSKTVLLSRAVREPNPKLSLQR